MYREKKKAKPVPRAMNLANCAIYFRLSIEWPWRTAVYRRGSTRAGSANRSPVAPAGLEGDESERILPRERGALLARACPELMARYHLRVVPVVGAGWARASRVIAIAAARASGRNGRLPRPHRRARSAERRVGVRLVVAKRRRRWGIAKGRRQGWTVREI